MIESKATDTISTQPILDGLNKTLLMIANNQVPLEEDRVKSIYISGPMTGYPDYNFEAFNKKAEELEAEGWVVRNPASHGIVKDASRHDYLRYDAAQLVTCSAIYMLEDWELSAGAYWEHELATFLGLGIMYERN